MTVARFTPLQNAPHVQVDTFPHQQMRRNGDLLTCQTPVEVA